jgi:hypothetical protein
VPGGCSTVMVAEVNATSVIVSVQRGLGQSGAPGMGDTGPWVVTLKSTLPFLISLAGIDWLPVSVTGAGFCPGGWLAPDGFVHSPVGLPVADNVTRTSPLPRPDNAPDDRSVRPVSVKLGSAFAPPLRCTLDAHALETPNAREPSTANIHTAIRLISTPLQIRHSLAAESQQFEREITAGKRQARTDALSVHPASKRDIAVKARSRLR